MESEYQICLFHATTSAWKTNQQQIDIFCSCHSSLSISSRGCHLMIGKDNHLF